MSVHTQTGERLRMRPWLECQVNNGRIPGLVWDDKSRKIFQVPWKHAGKPGFVLERDAMLFKEWARHTGKYKDGEQADPSTWKTRFRCALHKLPDVEELRDRSHLEGDEPYRVFQFIPKGTKTERSENAPSPAFTDVSVSPAPTIDMTHEDSQFFNAYQIPENGENSDVDQIQASMIDDYSEWNDNPVEHMNFSSSLDTEDFLDGMHNLDPAPAPTLNSNEISDMIGMDPQAMQVGVKIFYHEKQVLETVVGNHFGCRMYSGVDVTRAPGYNDSFAPVYGPAEVEQIRFPEEGSPTAIMDKLNRGLLLQWQQNSIQVTRFCQAHVYASGGCLGSNIVQLVRGQPTKVFDFNFFLSGLAEYKLAKAPVPLYEVFFSFGQQPATATTVDPGVLITVSVTHMNAKASISKMGSASDVIMSIEDECDVLAKHLQHVVRIQQPGNS